MHTRMTAQRPCRTCGNPLPEGLKQCPRDGTPADQNPVEGQEASWESTVRKDIMVGQRIGEYVVRRRIGSGGMGVVYEGEHPDIGRKVAIKIIRPDSSESVRSRELLAEARAVSAIRHRGIIDIFGFGTLPGVGQYLVMEFLNGRPLDEVLLDRAPMPPAEVIRLMTEVLDALSAAHAEGVIHRDLKPGNIFVVLESNGYEYVKVLDFGLAKKGAEPNSATPQSSSSMIVGTPEYMAPEQACGQAVSPRTDLYAAGIIMFEMLTGRLPFRGDSRMHVAIMQVHDAPPAPSSLVDGLPPELDALILRLLAKDPAQRPLSAEQVMRELRGIAKMLAVDMTRLSGFVRAMTDSELRSGVRQAAPNATTQRTLTDREGQAVEPALAETFISASSPPALTPAPVEQGPSRSAPPAAPTREQAARARPVEPTTEARPSGDLMPGGPRAKVALVVGLSMLLVGVGVVALGRGGGSSVPVVVDPVVLPAPRPEPEPQVVTVAQQAPAPVPDSKDPVETPSQVEPTPPPNPEPEPVARRKKAPSGDKPRSSLVAGTGSLQIVSECFAEVYVGKQFKGRLPIKALSLEAGWHTLELRGNPGIPLKERMKKLRIHAGKPTEYVVNCPSE
jgi:serine/threonine-protein kinase